MNKNLAFNQSSAKSLPPGITQAMLSGSLRPIFNLSADNMALLNRSAQLAVAELEKERAKLVAMNGDAYGYDIYKSVSAAAVEGFQAGTNFVNAIRLASPEDTSIPWHQAVTQWDMEDLLADATNSGSTQTPGNKDNAQVEQDSMSLPFQIAHAGGIDPRTLEQSRAAGRPINARFAREGGKAIARLVETNSLGVGTGNPKYYGSLSNYGVYDNPNISTGTLHAAWTTTTTPEKIIKDIAQMKADLVAKGFPDEGAYVVTVSSDYGFVLDNLINPQANNVFGRELIENMHGISKVVVSSYAPTAKVSLTYAGSVEPIVQLDVTVVPYGGYNGSDWGTQNWVIFSAMNIRHLVDKNSNFGVAVYSAP